MYYSKKDALMTRGLAIISMVVLHLFCRQGADVLGTPLIWLNESKPLVYLFGFFSEICVPLYSLCAGYAQELLYEQNRSSRKDRMHRIGKLLINYWIIVVLFSILGLFFDSTGNMPGSWSDFAKSLVLLHSYNGAWWYLHTYIIMLMIPSHILLWPVRKLKLVPGLLLCFVMNCAWYAIQRIGLLPDAATLFPAAGFVLTEVENLIGILAYIWAGAYLCRNQCMERAEKWFDQKVQKKWQKAVLLSVFLAVFLGFNTLHKSVLIGIVAMTVFFLFNLWKKSRTTERIFLFLGRHSTNIWLTHMFFYIYVFTGLVQRAKYPLFMLGFMMILCIMTSYIVQTIYKGLERILNLKSLGLSAP